MGPMFSGKTSELLREMKRHVLRKETVISIKSTLDSRTHDREGLLTSRDDTWSPVTHQVDRQLVFDELIGERPSCVIAIDEAQFFDNLVDFCAEATSKGHLVVASALSADFRMQPFPQVALLAARSIVRGLVAVCHDCGADALHTRKVSGDASQIVDVGDGDKYQAACTGCYLKAHPYTKTE